MVNYLQVRCHDLEVGFTCALCRSGYSLKEHAIKELFSSYVPTHSKVVGACCGKQYAVSHTPCSDGCYACDSSDIHIVEL